MLTYLMEMILTFQRISLTQQIYLSDWMQSIYQTIAAYFKDDCADELTNDPVFLAVLEKEALASQPTLSRFWNRMDEDTLKKLDTIDSRMREIIYSIKRPEMMVFDLDSTLLATYGKQEGKGGFVFSSVSSYSKTVNANRLRIHALAYNLFNWFRRLMLPASMRKQRVDTIRLKLLKIAARVIRSARYITFKLCSSCPYKREYHETLSNIQQLSVQLE